MRIKPPPVKKHRTRYVNLRLTEDESRLLASKAKAAGISKSELLRDHIGKLRVTPRRDRRELLLALARIGSNLNQLARWANSVKSAADAATICAYLVSLGEELRALERRIGRRVAGDDESAS